MRRAHASMRPLIVATLVLAVAALPILLTGAVSVQLRAELGFGPTALGACFAVFFGGAAMGSAPLGYLAQRLGFQRSLRISSTLSAVMLLGIGAMAQSWLMLISFLAVAGTGLSMAHPGTNMLIKQALPVSRHGFAMGIKQSGIPVATLLGGSSVPVFAVTVGWRWAYVAAAVIAALTALAVPSPRDTATTSMNAVTRSTVRGTGLGSRPALILLAIGLALGSAGATSSGAFAVSTAVHGGLAETVAGLFYAAASIAGVLVRLIAGHLADRRANRELHWVGCMLLAGAVGYVLLGVGDARSVYVGLLLGVALGWGWFGLFDLSIVRSYPDVIGSVTGVVKIGAFLGGIMGPLGLGTLAERYSLSTAWFTAAVLAVLSATLMVSVATMRQRGRLLPPSASARVSRSTEISSNRPSALPTGDCTTP
jgi:MFS family permease